MIVVKRLQGLISLIQNQEKAELMEEILVFIQNNMYIHNKFSSSKNLKTNIHTLTRIFRNCSCLRKYIHFHALKCAYLSMH